MLKQKHLTLGLVALLSVVSLPTLQGCAGAAFVAGGAAAGMIVYDRRNFQTIQEDQRIRHQVENKLHDDFEISKDAHITAATFNGIVLLAGQAPTVELRERANAAAQSIAGVRRVYNEVALMAPTSQLVRSSDTWITTKVRGELLLVQDLRSSQIKVITENGTVYLMGLVTQGQGDLATAATRQVAGVQRVVKLFENYGDAKTPAPNPQ